MTLHIVNGPMRSGTGFYTIHHARELGLPVADYTLYWAPGDPGLMRLSERDPVDRKFIDWELLRDQEAVVHADLCLEAVEQHPDMLENMITIVRDPRNALVSAARKWHAGVLLAMLQGHIAGRTYTTWIKGIAALAMRHGFIKYEEQEFPGWEHSTTDWRDTWSDIAEMRWVALGMAEMERSLGYNLANA